MREDYPFFPIRVKSVGSARMLGPIGPLVVVFAVVLLSVGRESDFARDPVRWQARRRRVLICARECLHGNIVVVVVEIFLFSFFLLFCFLFC